MYKQVEYVCVCVCVCANTSYIYIYTHTHHDEYIEHALHTVVPTWIDRYAHTHAQRHVHLQLLGPPADVLGLGKCCFSSSAAWQDSRGPNKGPNKKKQ